MAARKTATAKKVAPIAPPPRYIILNDCYDNCSCGEDYQSLNKAVEDAMGHFDEGCNDAIYVVQIVKTIHRGKPTVSEGYFDTDPLSRS